MSQVGSWALRSSNATRERGWRAQAIASRWEGESDEADVLPEAAEAGAPPPGLA